MLSAARLNGALNKSTFFFSSALHCNDKRQRCLSFTQVVTKVFPHFYNIAVVVQHIINHLKCRAQRLSIICTAFLNIRRRLCQQSRQTGACLKQLGRFRTNHPQVAFIRQCRIMHVHELQYLALSNDIGSLCKCLHDAHVASIHHHLKGAGIKKISH